MKKILLLLPIALMCVISVFAQDSTAKKELVGKYKFPDGSVVAEVDVLIDNGVLMMNSSAGTSSLDFLKPDSFSIVAFNGTAVFKRNDQKKIIGVHIDAGGYILDGVKDSVKLNSFSLRATMLKNENAGADDKLNFISSNEEVLLALIADRNCYTTNERRFRNVLITE
jgi:hypothetical protein